MDEIAITGTDLDIAGVFAVSRSVAGAVLADAGRANIEASWRFAIDEATRRPLYGRSTGVGANRTVPVTGDRTAHALDLLRSHATSAGAPRSADRVRAMLVIRLNQLAAGGSGAGPGLADGLVGMLRADALPVVREWGSIGTGDLSALATTALTLLGELPTVDGRTLPPVPFEGPDGLAFISSNAATLADAALGTTELLVLARACLGIAALTFAAVDGNAEAFAPAVRQATPFPGVGVVCASMRRLVGEGDARPPARIQDPFGLRALPQVMGPVLDALSGANAVLVRMINAPSENPVLLPPTDTAPGQVAHHGAFYASYLQSALDGLNLAVAQSGQLVMARLATLIEPAFTGLAPFLSDGTPGASGVMVCEYVAASALGELRAAAQPAGLQTVTLSRGVEEDASFASLAASATRRMAGPLRTLLAAELVAAVRAHRMRAASVTGPVGELLEVCAALPAATEDRDLTEDLRIAEELLPSIARLVPLTG
ncbi:aromatic amino acid lyase [Nakamurella alba]|uniref:aromatic amino acid lyase n=1 Tax=Nakamurella alba TaxID=2665158 RepID=UPI0018AC4854|nr:aromatic amino acid lyase [Nakamurella alba]